MSIVRTCSLPVGETSMTVLLLTLTTLALSRLGTLMATSVALLARDPARRADARRVLRLLLTRTAAGRRP
jgi:hypothetical protein